MIWTTLRGPYTFQVSQRSEHGGIPPHNGRDSQSPIPRRGAIPRVQVCLGPGFDPPKKLNWKRVRDKIADVVAAFANADGGILFVGVEDDGQPSGHGYSDQAVAGLLEVPENRLQPEVRCRTGRIDIDGRQVLVFEVPRSAEAIMVVADDSRTGSVPRFCANPRNSSTSGNKRCGWLDTSSGFARKPRSTILTSSWRSDSWTGRRWARGRSRRCLSTTVSSKGTSRIGRSPTPDYFSSVVVLPSDGTRERECGCSAWRERSGFTEGTATSPKLGELIRHWRWHCRKPDAWSVRR